MIAAHTAQVTTTGQPPSDDASLARGEFANLIPAEFIGLKSSLADINAAQQSGVEQRQTVQSTYCKEYQEEHLSPTAIDANKIPPTVVGVHKQQFKIMNAWMQPIRSATVTQRKENKALLKQLEECSGSTTN